MRRCLYRKTILHHHKARGRQNPNQRHTINSSMFSINKKESWFFQFGLDGLTPGIDKHCMHGSAMTDSKEPVLHCSCFGRSLCLVAPNLCSPSHELPWPSSHVRPIALHLSPPFKQIGLCQSRLCNSRKRARCCERALSAEVPSVRLCSSRGSLHMDDQYVAPATLPCFAGSVALVVLLLLSFLACKLL